MLGTTVIRLRCQLRLGAIKFGQIEQNAFPEVAQYREQPDQPKTPGIGFGGYCQGNAES